MPASDDLKTAAILAALAQAEQRARRAGGRGRKTKKLKGLRRPAKAGAANKGCGTGAGGFAAGNKCALEDGVPQKPVRKGGPLTKPSVSKTRKKAETLRRKAAQKQKEKEAKAKAGKDKFAYEKKRARRRAAEKAAAEKKQEAARKQAAEAKRNRMLQSIRIKKANEKLEISDTGKSIAQEIEEAKAALASNSKEVQAANAEALASTKKTIEDSPIRAVLERAQTEYVSAIKSSIKSGCHTGDGLCSPTAEGVATSLSGRYRDDIEVSEYFGAGGPRSRDHASVVVVDHGNGVAYEVDVPETTYQTRTPDGGFTLKQGVNVTTKDVLVRELDYKEFQLEALERKPGETDVDFLMRRKDRSVKSFEDEVDRIIKSGEAKIAEARSYAEKAEKLASETFDEYLSEARKSPEDGFDQAKVDMLSRRLAADRKLSDEMDLQIRVKQRELRQGVHDALTEYVSREAGGLATVDGKSRTVVAMKSSKYKKRFLENADEAYDFLNRTLSPVHQEKLEAIELRLQKRADGGGGGAYYREEEIIRKDRTKDWKPGQPLYDIVPVQTAVSTTAGNNARYHTSTPVLVHEIAHGLHYGKRGSDAGSWAFRALAWQHRTKVETFRRENPDATWETYHPERQSYEVLRKPGQTYESPSNLGYSTSYADADHKSTPMQGIEVISTGVQEMFEDPSGFRKKYPYHFRLTAMFMAGAFWRAR